MDVAETALRLHFALTVDIVLITVRQGRLSVLLVERGGEPYRGDWALPGGFVDPNEETEHAAMRELAEETALEHLPEGIHLEQLRTYGRPGRDPRGRTVSVAYLALVPDLPSVKGGDDAAQARFWPIEDLASDDAPVLAFDGFDFLTTNYLFSWLFDIALAALLLHPQSRQYQKIWFT